MTVIEIATKILLFFVIFYGAIMLTTLITKKIEKKNHKDIDKEE